MKPQLLLVALSLVLTSCPSDEEQRLYLSEDATWLSPPAELELGYLYSEDAELVVIGPGDDVGAIHSVIHKDPASGALWLCEGCGQGADTGRIVRKGRTLKIKLRRGLRSLPALAGTPSEWEEEWTPNSDGTSSLVIKGKNYVRIEGLNNQAFLNRVLEGARTGTWNE